MKQPSRITCKVQVEGEDAEFLFRKPTMKDIWELMGSLPILREIASGVTTLDLENLKPREMLEITRCADAILCRCSIAPRLVTELAAKPPANTVCVEELQVDLRQLMYLDLMKQAGFGKIVEKEEEGDASASSPSSPTSPESGS